MIGNVLPPVLVTALWSGAAALWVVRGRLRRRAARLEELAPERALISYPAHAAGPAPAGRVFDVQGTVVSPAALVAPVSGEPCVAWELHLDEVLPATQDSDEGRRPLWRTLRSADLVVEYDARWDIEPDTRTGRPQQLPRDAPGRVEVRGDRVSADLQDGPFGMAFPAILGPVVEQRPVRPDLLAGLGVGPVLLERVARAPGGFVVWQTCLPAGARVRLVQQSPDPRRSMPDPDAPFVVMPLGQDFGQAGTGCLVTLLTAGALLALALGLLVLLASR